MTSLLIAVLNIILIVGIAQADESLNLNNKKVKVSYSVGYQVGSDFKRQGMDINPELLLKGVQDALLSNEPLMMETEMKTTLEGVQKKVNALEEEKSRTQAEKNLKEGQAFLVENAKKEGVQTLLSGMQYRILKEGEGKKPTVNDTVTVHYRGALIDGTEFDNSHKRNEPATFNVDRTIAGWKEALQLMKEGAKWQLFIPPQLAYGDKKSSRIEANNTLVFEVDLLSVQPAAK
jgi:FKBP-type peptidyl-prolyl cis-trans isomerase FklB